MNVQRDIVTCLDKLTMWDRMLNGRRIKQEEYCGELSGFNVESSTNQVSITLDIGELSLGLPPYLTVQLLYESRGKSAFGSNTLLLIKFQIQLL